MTAKRGMQWKTSWRRQKQTLGAVPVEMWFFHNDGGVGSFSFQQAMRVPGIGDTQPPFWCGFIAGLPGSPPVGITPDQAAVFRTFGFGTSWLGGAQRLLLNGVETYRALWSNYSMSAPVESLSPPLAPIVLRAVVVMIVATTDGDGNVVAQLWVDGAIRAQLATGVPYVSGLLPTDVLSFDPGTAYINSMAGGNALPTTDEIQAWFSASRYASPFPSAQEIPGKTLDRYDAANTPGVVPNPIANLAGGQPGALATSGGPTPVNVQLAATFGY